ncbi:MAG TPA: peptide-methionine (R)-S-oxide reductase MsrB [Bauldia sp.]|nr:peptide-methionine (R)-S-oxide reductase MsrB [Bauldia sp.]
MASGSSRRSFLLSSAAIAGLGAVGLSRFAFADYGETIVGVPGKVKIRKFSDDGKDLGVVEMDKVVKTEDEWKKQLANAPGTLDEQGTTAFIVTRQEGTEYAGTGPYSESFDAGLYRCICCDNALYSSDTKFDSGTGWPSFYKPIAEENVVQNVPQQGGYKVSCALCDAHLGHVFNDRPDQPTGLRYCMDGVALRFIPAPAKPA